MALLIAVFVLGLYSILVNGTAVVLIFATKEARPSIDAHLGFIATNVILAISILLVVANGLVLLGISNLLGFHIYLYFKNMSTYEYIIKH